MIEYHAIKAIRIIITFDNVDEFLSHRKFLKKENIVPLFFNPDHVVYGKVYSAYYNDIAGNKIIKWLESKGKHNKSIV